MIAVSSCIRRRDALLWVLVTSTILKSTASSCKTTQRLIWDSHKNVYFYFPRKPDEAPEHDRLCLLAKGTEGQIHFLSRQTTNSCLIHELLSGTRSNWQVSHLLSDSLHSKGVFNFICLITKRSCEKNLQPIPNAPLDTLKIEKLEACFERAIKSFTTRSEILSEIKVFVGSHFWWICAHT